MGHFFGRFSLPDGFYTRSGKEIVLLAQLPYSMTKRKKNSTFVSRQ